MDDERQQSEQEAKNIEAQRLALEILRMNQQKQHRRQQSDDAGNSLGAAEKARQRRAAAKQARQLQEKYPTLSKYNNWVDIREDWAQPLDVDEELLRLEQEAYELEQQVEKREEIDATKAAVQERINELREKLSGQTMPKAKPEVEQEQPTDAPAAQPEQQPQPPILSPAEQDWLTIILQSEYERHRKTKTIVRFCTGYRLNRQTYDFYKAKFNKEPSINLKQWATEGRPTDADQRFQDALKRRTQE
jgi:hypothetical protein